MNFTHCEVWNEGYHDLNIHGLQGLGRGLFLYLLYKYKILTILRIKHNILSFFSKDLHGYKCLPNTLMKLLQVFYNIKQVGTGVTLSEPFPNKLACVFTSYIWWMCLRGWWGHFHFVNHLNNFMGMNDYLSSW